MQVTISVGGRFHAFYLAQQLLKRGNLKSLITSYPKFEVVKYGIAKNKVSTVIIKEVIERFWNSLPSTLTRFYNPQYATCEIFDQMAKKHLVDSDILVAWSSFALHTIRKAKDMRMKTILERGSSHILYQVKILKEEYDKWGLKQQQLPHPKIIEKELQEYKEVDYIAIPSLFVKRSFLEKGIPEGKLIHVPYGVHLDEFRQILKEDTIFRVVYVGGMTIRKGVHYLLQAFSDLKLPKSELLLVGSVSEEIKPFFKKYEGNYRWVGSVSQKELYRYYSQGSVFVIMSIEEGLAMVQLQAMACGLPVICTTNTGGEDIIKNGSDGFIIPIRDVETLKEKLVYLYQNPDICKAMGQSAKERASKGFTWNDYGERIIEAYKSILKNEF